jgi:hypothetical protein
MAYLAADVTIMNTSAGVMRYRADSFRVRDSEGYQYPLRPLPTGEQPQPALGDGELLPAGAFELEPQARGWVTFEVAVNARGLILEYLPRPDPRSITPPAVRISLQD